MTNPSFDGLRVASFEARRKAEMASLIERYGGIAVQAPAMREVVVSEENPLAIAFAKALAKGAFDVVILTTGVGVRALVAACAPVSSAEELASGLARSQVIVRGPKPAAALRELGFKTFAVAREPNTWCEVLSAVRSLGLPPSKIALQEHGAPSRELQAALESDGHEVHSIAIYRWALPEDTRPLESALREVAAGTVQVVLFTSATQVAHALRFAHDHELEPGVRAGLARSVVCSIGPVCSEALEGEGISVDVEPEHSKMGHLVKAAAERAGAILRANHPRLA